jgi:hypothetical protein
LAVGIIEEFLDKEIAEIVTDTKRYAGQLKNKGAILSPSSLE